MYVLLINMKMMFIHAGVFNSIIVNSLTLARKYKESLED